MSDQVKELLVKQLKLFGVQILELAGHALLKTAKEISSSQEKIEQQN